MIDAAGAKGAQVQKIDNKALGKTVFQISAKKLGPTRSAQGASRADQPRSGLAHAA